MLLQVLREIEQADGPVTLAELSRRLDVAPSALQGMIDFWVSKGRLQDTSAPTEADGMTHGCGTKSCSGSPETCAYIAKMPRTLSIRSSGEKASA